MILVHELEDYDGSSRWKPCFISSNMNNAQAIIAKLKEERMYAIYNCQELVCANSYTEFVLETEKLERAEAFAKLSLKDRRLLGIKNVDS